MSELKKIIIKGTIWSVGGQIGTLLIILITNIWLARILSPEEFGKVGIIMFFVLIANVLTESGLGGALIRKKEPTENDYSTVFVSNIVFSIVFYIFFFIVSEAIASFYDDKLLENLLIVAGSVLIINAFQLTQNAKLVKEMRFKEQSIYRFLAVLISSVSGIYLAHKGFGVWSLVFIQILTAVINTGLLWIFEDSNLRFYFSKKSFKELYSFGINTTLASLLNTGFDNIYQLILGKFFSMSQTGYFYQAKRLQDVPGSVIIMLTHSVIFSSLAKLQDDKLAFTKAYNKITLYFLVLLGLISSLIYVYAEQLIILLFGIEWFGSIYYIQLLTIASFFYIQENINRVIFKVFNQTRKILYLEYAKKTIQAISIAVGVFYSNLELLIIGFVITNVIGYLINFYYSRKVVEDASFYELKTLLKVAAVSVLSVMGIMLIVVIFQLENYQVFLTFPLLLLIYLTGLSLLKVIDLRKEILNIKSLYEM